MTQMDPETAPDDTNSNRLAAECRRNESWRTPCPEEPSGEARIEGSEKLDKAEHDEAGRVTDEQLKLWVHLL